MNTSIIENFSILQKNLNEMNGEPSKNFISGYKKMAIVSAYTKRARDRNRRRASGTVVTIAGRGERGGTRDIVLQTTIKGYQGYFLQVRLCM